MDTGRAMSDKSVKHQKIKQNIHHKKKETIGNVLPPLQNFDAFEKIKQLEKKLKLKNDFYR